MFYLAWHIGLCISFWQSNDTDISKAIPRFTFKACELYRRLKENDKLEELSDVPENSIQNFDQSIANKHIFETKLQASMQNVMVKFTVCIWGIFERIALS